MSDFIPVDGKYQPSSVPNCEWMPYRDGYGRPVKALRGPSIMYRFAAVVVTLPKRYRQENPERGYLVNDWTNPDRDAAVTYHPTLAAAKAHAEMVVDRDKASTPVTEWAA